ncbi:pentatricopeptide repeat-containing protein At1g74600, chloroplastic isoform X1 [Typha latifolia]|uniref:pentatricopeptide repeat-containing protein At1g74600, chloroplastic isoform X1 n=2 Tax=Typha latifolia TaxID=4733 RepID=UPI003C2BA822
MNSLLHFFSQSLNPILFLRLFSSLSIIKIPSNFHLRSRKIVSSFRSSHTIIHDYRTAQLSTLSSSQPESNKTHVTKLPLLPSDTFASNRLADSYLKSGAVFEALHLLDEIPHPNLISWNLMLSCYNKEGQFDRSLRTFCKMRLSGFEPNQFTYGSVLSACVSSENRKFGEQVYSLVLKNGFFSNGYVCAGMIDLFAKSGRLDDALKVSSDICWNVVCWNAIIAGAVRNEENFLALEIFCDMVAGFCMPNAFTFSSVLCACAAAGELDVGRGVHAWVIKCDSGDDVFVGTAIVDLYAKCGDMDAAMKEFWQMPVRNVVSWTAAISGFVQKDKIVDAVVLFKEMIGSGVKMNKCTLTSVLLACSKFLMAQETNQVHCFTMKTGLYLDPTVKEALINTYAQVGNIQLSEKVFRESGKVKSSGIWSALISGLGNQSLIRSVELLKKMLSEGSRPDKKCFSVLLSIVDSMEFGRQMHSSVIKDGSAHDVLVSSALSTMYSRCGSIKDGYKLFKQMKERDRVSWTSMISGFAGYGCSVEAFQLFREMLLEDIKPDQVALSAILAACDGHRFVIRGKEIHGHALRVGFGTDIPMMSAIVSMYSKCKNILSARRVFDAAFCKDQVIWSSMISGYAANGYSEEALSLFQQIGIAGFQIDNFTCSSVLGVCANLSKPGLGRQLHGHSIKAGTIAYLSVSSALVTMYSKCGRIDESRRLFDEIEYPDLVTWTAMIDGYAQHGSGLDALTTFKLMNEHGVKPDAVTLVSILSACSHNGLVKEGFVHFNSMRTVYGIEPESHHYACMVDLLGRSGRIDEAVNFIDNMPIKPDSLVWSTLLAACRVHGDVELGRFVMKKVLEMKSYDSGSYISLSNISADVGDWEEVVRIRRSMMDSGMKKEPGWSMI